MHAFELRRAFLDFFTARGHTAVPSAGLIPHHPSAPMFTNSGMMPFVPYFLGEERVPFDPPRAVSIQKCVRAGGKHNDLDAIGRSPRHLSFFEMLGNFSFGDYFKAEAIPWAWEFVTDTLGIDGDRLWITCHTTDDEAEDIWADAVGVPRARIQRLDKDNFWEMGEIGPCGPSSEIFFDFGPDLGPDGGPANPEAEHRFVEIWNLVFTQYFRNHDGSLSDLPAVNVDTGAGMERILAVLAGSHSLYSADVLSELVDTAQRTTGHRLGESELHDVALRLIADHTRTATFLIADGVIPSNEDRGYVLRRIMRRAVRFAYLMGVETLVLPAMAERCIEVMVDGYPDLRGAHDQVLAAVTREETKFRETLRTGSTLLDNALDGLPAGGTLSGAVAFKLHDTYGFPLDVTREVAELRGFGIDEPGFDDAMANQKAMASAAQKSRHVATGDDADRYQQLVAEHGATTFVGREVNESSATVLGVVGDTIVLDVTPFYAESGGQVGDTGTIAWPGGSVEVVDTMTALPGLVAHRVRSGLATPAPGTAVVASIDADRRNAIRRHHTATHLLHWALRSVLGDHVNQQGSWVGPDRLRFDFAHFAALSPDEIRAVEDLANREILGNAVVDHYETSKDEALAKGAMAFFGDKYGDVVRVLEAGPSIELCGGTHVRSLGDIGPVKVVSETSIGSNIRRLEAVAGTGPIDLLRSAESTLGAAADAVGVPVADLLDGLRKRSDDLRALRDEVRALRRQLASAAAGDLVSDAIDGVLVARVEADNRDEVRDLAVSLRDRPGMRAVVLMASPGGKGVAVVAAVTAASGLNAGELIAEALPLVGGGGGKGAEIATAGGRNADGIDAALDLVRSRFAAS